jgi:methylglutaconyl-CoA hydratase
MLMSGPEAVRQAKRLVASVVAMDRADVREYTAQRIAQLRAAPEGQEGLRAFLEKRSPAWRDQAP